MASAIPSTTANPATANMRPIIVVVDRMDPTIDSAGNVVLPFAGRIIATSNEKFAETVKANGSAKSRMIIYWDQKPVDPTDDIVELALKAITLNLTPLAFVGSASRIPPAPPAPPCSAASSNYDAFAVSPPSASGGADSRVPPTSPVHLTATLSYQSDFAREAYQAAIDQGDIDISTLGVEDEKGHKVDERAGRTASPAIQHATVTSSPSAASPGQVRGGGQLSPMSASSTVTLPQ